MHFSSVSPTVLQLEAFDERRIFSSLCGSTNHRAHVLFHWQCYGGVYWDGNRLACPHRISFKPVSEENPPCTVHVIVCLKEGKQSERGPHCPCENSFSSSLSSSGLTNSPWFKLPARRCRLLRCWSRLSTTTAGARLQQTKQIKRKRKSC